MSARRGARRVTSATLVTLGALATSAHAVAPQGVAMAPIPSADSGLSISAPSGAALGAGPAGTDFSAQLGPVTVSAPAGVSQWTATVALTTAFGVTQGDQTWYLPGDRVHYRSGAATAGTAALALCTPGQLASQTLVQTRTAFRCQGLPGLTASSVSWRPTLTVDTGPTDPAGSFAGTITHSVF